MKIFNKQKALVAIAEAKKLKEAKENKVEIDEDVKKQLEQYGIKPDSFIEDKPEEGAKPNNEFSGEKFFQELAKAIAKASATEDKGEKQDGKTEFFG